MSLALELDGVVAGYGHGGDVLHGVDLDVPERGITAIVGPNGAGKSTLLRVVSGLLSLRSGSIAFEGESLGRSGPHVRLRLGIVHIPQPNALFRDMSVRENVLMGAYAVRRSRDVVRKRYAAICEAFPIVRERAREPAGNLSGGQRRMVEFARCMMSDPRLLLLDEPSVGLDPIALQAAFDRIRDMARSGPAILLAEQNVQFAAGLADTGLVLEGGQVRKGGSAGDVFDDAGMAELYFGGQVARSDETERVEPRTNVPNPELD